MCLVFYLFISLILYGFQVYAKPVWKYNGNDILSFKCHLLSVVVVSASIDSMSQYFSVCCISSSRNRFYRNHVISSLNSSGVPF